MNSLTTDSITARSIDQLAHSLRGTAGVAKSGMAMVAELANANEQLPPELLTDTAEAIRDICVTLECLIASARLEIRTTEPPWIEDTVLIVATALKRAKREGARTRLSEDTPTTMHAIKMSSEINATIFERLICDVAHTLSLQSDGETVATIRIDDSPNNSHGKSLKIALQNDGIATKHSTPEYLNILCNRLARAAGDNVSLIMPTTEDIKGAMIQVAVYEPESTPSSTE